MIPNVKTIENCPHCQIKGVIKVLENGLYEISCPMCKSTGGRGKNEFETIEKWNRTVSLYIKEMTRLQSGNNIVDSEMTSKQHCTHSETLTDLNKALEKLQQAGERMTVTRQQHNKKAIIMFESITMNDLTVRTNTKD